MTPHDRALELLELAQRDEHGHVCWEPIPRSTTRWSASTTSRRRRSCSKRDVDFPRTYDLVGLMELIEVAGYGLPVTDEELDWLTPFASL